MQNIMFKAMSVNTLSGDPIPSYPARESVLSVNNEHTR